MTSTTGFQRTPRDPNMAAMLSMVPGLGQLYNGENRKGALFLSVAAINFVFFLVLVFTDPILRSLIGYGASMHIRLNRELVMAIQQVHIGSPPSLVIIGLFLSFIGYAVRDAYDHAAMMQRRHIYPEFVMEMPEATSGSYLVHVSTMMMCFLLAFFFLIPPPAKQQTTEIEFIQNQEEVKKKVVSPRRAQHNSENSGKHEPKKEVTAPSPAPKAPSKAEQQQKPTPKAAAQPTPKPTPEPVKPTPTPSPHPSPTPSPHPSPTPSPHPAPTPSPHPSPSPSPTPTPTPRAMPTPTPFMHPTAAPSPNPSPSPSPMAVNHGGGPSLAPTPRAGSGGAHGSAPSPAPAPITGTSGAAGGGAPSPSPVAGGGAPKLGGGSGPAPAPAPTRAGKSGGGGSAGGGSPMAMASPNVPRAAAGGGGGDGAKGNPDANDKPGRPSVSAQADVDFGPYMADLQRRIKRAWFPPKGNESKRVVVVFKVHRGGELSNLRIDHSSGVAVADQAALKAVENAAPFRPLPAGASDDVDIQFTFDYNVFNGGGHGTFRSF